MGKSAGLWIALAAGAVIFLFGAVTPRPAQTDAPPTAFSAGRAMADIRAMGATPHAVGSPANAAVRDYLVGRMTRLGLDPAVRRGRSFAVYGSEISGATVDNVVGILPGRDRSLPAVALMAHHDSVPGSPGAADDTAGVASALEIVRAIAARGAPLRDVMVVITDGEEAGLLGARAFFDQDPLAGHVGYVLNLETRGGGGRAAMFETAPANGGDIALYRRTAAMPSSNALTVFVYRRMPNSTDFTVALAHGKRGLNYAFIGREFDYHSPSATPAALDQGALQHMGAQTLPTAAALAFGPLPAPAPDVVYGNVVGDVTAAYPAEAGWLALAAAAAMIVTGAWRARRRSGLAAADLARGAGASVYLLALSGALLELVRRATGVGDGFMAYRPILAQFPLFEAMMLAAALGGVMASAAFAGRGRSRLAAAGVALAAGMGASAFAGLDSVGLVLGGVGALAGAATFGRPAGAPGAWTGLLATALAAALAIQLVAPTAAAAVAWPLLAGALASALSAAGSDRRPVAVAGVVVVAALALGWIGGLFHQLLQGLDLPLLAALPPWLAGLVLWPLASSEAPRAPSPWPAVAAIAVGLALSAVIRFDDPWTARRPNAVEPIYIVDPAARRAWRASVLPPDAWTRGVLRVDGGRVAPLKVPFERDPLWAAPARFVPAAPPRVVAAVGPADTLTLAAEPRPDAASLWIAVRSPAPISHVTLDGSPAAVHVKLDHWLRVRWSGADRFTLTLRAGDPRRVEVVTGEVVDRWLAATPLPPVPARDQLWDLAGSTLVVGRVSPASLTPGG